MKFRNRKKHGFKRLRKQMQVYDYCSNRIKKGESFKIVDIARDLNIARSTVIEILQELSEKNNNFIYDRGCIKIEGLGNNGYGKIAENEEGLVVKKMSKTTKTRLEKKERVYNYLCYLVNSNQKIPCLSYLSEHFTDMHMTTLMSVLKDLDKDNKIIYKRGQVIAVNVPDVKADRQKVLKYNSGEADPEEEGFKPLCSTKEVSVQGTLDLGTIENTFSFMPVEAPKVNLVSIDTSKYDKAVKDLIADYILNANISTREEIVEYVDSIMKITDKLKDKLYRPGE